MKIQGVLAVSIFVSANILSAQPAHSGAQIVKEQLGKALFFDETLSEPRGQSCATCHKAQFGFNGAGDGKLSQMPGAISTRFGPRNPPSAAYAFASPTPEYRMIDGERLYIGGQFWDGRAATLADQAKAPFLNTDEMNNRTVGQVVEKVCKGRVTLLFTMVYGSQVCMPGNTAKAFDAIADAIATFERSAEVNPFSSKFDRYLDGKAQLTAKEKQGLELFEGKALCSQCHPTGVKSPFTDFSYDNIGIPQNKEGAHFKIDPVFIDKGLGALLGPDEDGKFKVPTLRNVAISPPYGHNGFFKTLKDVVHFYNTRDVDRKWPKPEVLQNLNRDELGDLKLTGAEEDAIVVFLGTLTDGR